MPKLFLTSSNTAVRAQILSNLSAIGFTPRGTYDVVVAKSGISLVAWVILVSVEPRKAIMRGPPCGSCEDALEKLLEATAEMVAEKFEPQFGEFETQLSRMVGDGAFVLENVPTGLDEVKGKKAAVEEDVDCLSGELQKVEDWNSKENTTKEAEDEISKKRKEELEAMMEMD